MVLDLMSIVELLELGSTEQKTSYVTPLKLMALGKVMGLGSETRVIDFGCAKAKALILWGKYMQIKGVGVEINERFCEIAMERIMSAGLSDRIKIDCADAATYQVPQSSYDVACCIGASNGCGCIVWCGDVSQRQRRWERRSSPYCSMTCGCFNSRFWPHGQGRI